MKSFNEIAEQTGTTIDDVREAFEGAERTWDDGAWFVATRSNGACGHANDRESHAVGFGATKTQAVIDALENIDSWR